MSVKVGDVVVLAGFGREVLALVRSTRSGEVSHLGAAGEPLISVAFIDPARDLAIAPNKNAAHQLPETQLAKIYEEHDVVHFSHEFDDEFQKKHGSSPAQIAAQRGHYEWKEYAGGATELVNRLRDNFTAVAAQRNEAQEEAAKQKARADLAEELDALKKAPPEAQEEAAKQKARADLAEELDALKKAPPAA